MNKELLTCIRALHFKTINQSRIHLNDLLSLCSTSNYIQINSKFYSDVIDAETNHKNNRSPVQLIMAEKDTIILETGLPL